MIARQSDVLREVVRETRDAPASVRRQSAVGEPGDLRGIPVIAHGVGGTSPGSNPESVTRGRAGEWSPRRAA